MTFVVKDWKDCRSGGTPTDAAALKDLEKRLSDYTDLTAGAPGRPGSQYTIFNPAEQVIPDAGFISSTPADKLAFVLPADMLVRIYAQLNAWNTGAGDVVLQLYIDDNVVMNERGLAVAGSIGNGAEGPVVLRQDQLTNGTLFVVGGGGTSNPCPFPDMSGGMNVFLPQGAHTVEIKYGTAGVPAHITQRRLLVTA